MPRFDLVIIAKRLGEGMTTAKVTAPLKRLSRKQRPYQGRQGQLVTTGVTKVRVQFGDETVELGLEQIEPS